jgi:putative heme-binding domain-containing protein
MTHLGPAAPAGLTRYGRDLLCAQFNMRKVSRHQLHPDGATYRTTDTDFLVCDHPDFHPTDVFQAPDGSVLVIDTGGWYKLCCPTSQVAKPNVLGAIYRLRKSGGEVSPDVPPSRLASGEPPRADRPADALAHRDPHVRRKAAEALAAARDASAIPSLFAALAAPGVDRFLFHAYANALLEIGAADPTRSGLAHDHPSVRAAAIYALEQLPAGGLTAEAVRQPLAADDDRLREAALFTVGRHPEWADSLADWMRTRLATPDAGGQSVQRALVALGNTTRIRALLGTELAAAESTPARLQLLGAMAALRPENLPAEWRDGIVQVLASGEPAETAAALAVIRLASAKDRAAWSGELAQLAHAADTEPATRLQALAAMGRHLLEEDTFRFVLSRLDHPTDGNPAATALATHSLSATQLVELAAVLPHAGLLERPLLLKCFAGQSDEAAGLALVAALDRARAVAATPPDTLRETFAAFPESVRQALAAAQAKSRPPDQAARLAELEMSLPAGDAERGLIVFQTTKAACATCHPVGYKGGTLGPDLSKVGAVRTRRDLLEALVFPSLSFVRSYETVLLTRHDGTTAYGIVTNQGGDAVTVATGAATPPVRVPRTEIKHLAPGQFSLMPQGIDQILTPQELADVMAYLQSRR